MLGFLVGLDSFLQNPELCEANWNSNMSEVDSTARKKTWKTEWSNLPHELLSQIANSLGLIDLLSFRGVCKDWRNASLKGLSHNKSFGCDPWFLLYDGEGSKCSLVSNHEEICTINIPELDGTTCLASHEGWLLLFRNGSMFFFCPFSRAKLELPNCPFTDLSDHMAAFSSAPTSQDCMVAVISRSSGHELELHLLCLGDNIWTQHNFNCNEQTFSTVKAAAFTQGEFHFLDSGNGLVTFDAAESKQWNQYRIVSPSEASVKDVLTYLIFYDCFIKKDMKRKLGLETNISISTCGTLASGEYDIMIKNESIEGDSASESRHLKGVWILPRYHIPPDQRS